MGLHQHHSIRTAPPVARPTKAEARAALDIAASVWPNAANLLMAIKKAEGVVKTPDEYVDYAADVEAEATTYRETAEQERDYDSRED